VGTGYGPAVAVHGSLVVPCQACTELVTPDKFGHSSNSGDVQGLRLWCRGYFRLGRCHLSSWLWPGTGRSGGWHCVCGWWHGKLLLYRMWSGCRAFCGWRQNSSRRACYRRTEAQEHVQARKPSRIHCLSAKGGSHHRKAPAWCAVWPSSIAESQLSAFQDRGYDTTTISNSSTAWYDQKSLAVLLMPIGGSPL